MAINLFGREWTRRELLERIGSLSQVAGVERFTFTEGCADGVRAARVRTGGGLDFTVLMSRGMDIGAASYKGVPFAWQSATEAAHPHALDQSQPNGRGWLRSFHGGLLTGCGLSNAGAANVDGDEHLGIHGFLSHIPADETFAGIEWGNDDSAQIVVRGVMRETRVFGENLHLQRTITAPLGGNHLRVEDTVTNVGFAEVPLMLLYHLNFGFPLVSENTEIITNATIPPEPRDADAEMGKDSANQLTAPTPDYREQCFFHSPRPDGSGYATVQMTNNALPLTATVRYDARALPHLTQWKMIGQGEYVCGIEPANCRVFGRSTERAAGRLQTIAPGETRTFTVEIGVSDRL
ncbi:MAG: aldose 1-epimerase family protein [Fibrella sp.]|nr:aldose 1-epimerase family protein [Armatimonadota bacterium]